MTIALKTLYSLINSNFEDFSLCRADFMQSRLKIFYTNADALLNMLNELRLILEVSCHHVVVIT